MSAAMNDRISEAELDVMAVLWEEAPLAASDVADRLKTRKDWSAQTVKTLLARLVDKGAAAHEPDGRRYLYRPLVSRNAYAGAATQSFIDRLFKGRAAPLVANLAEAGALSDQDIRELEAIIQELKRERD